MRSENRKKICHAAADKVGNYFNDDCPSAVNFDGNHEQHNAQDGGDDEA